MSTGVYVSKNGRVTEAVGAQPKEALLFAPFEKISTQILREQRSAMKRNNSHIKDRFARAHQR